MIQSLINKEQRQIDMEIENWGVTVALIEPNTQYKGESEQFYTGVSVRKRFVKEIMNLRWSEKS